MLRNFLTERRIGRTLRRLSRQRVALILQPGDIWVVERAISDDAETEAHLRTCQLRGWVEPVSNAVPRGRLTDSGGLPSGQLFDDVRPIYRLTDSGWAAINRSHMWVVLGAIIALASLFAALALR